MGFQNAMHFIFNNQVPDRSEIEMAKFYEVISNKKKKAPNTSSGVKLQ
jgi:hypothetical protein